MDPTTLDTRKPIDHLTPADLVAFPIWEFAIDEEGVEGRDETWVRPVRGNNVGKGLWSLSVAADFRTPSGTVFPGLIDVTTADGVELGHGALFVDGQYVFVNASDDASRVDTAWAMGLGLRDAFPLTFTLRVRIAGEKALRTGSFR